MKTIINQINQTITNVCGDNPHTLAISNGEVVRVTSLKNYPFCSLEHLDTIWQQVIRDILFEAERYNGLHSNAVLSFYHMEYKGVQPPLDSSTY